MNRVAILSQVITNSHYQITHERNLYIMPNSYNILLVGGTFSNTANPDGSYGAVSGVLRHVYNALNNYPNFKIKYVNGGKYDILKTLLTSTPQYDFVFWWANVNNSLEKIRNVKEIAPLTMLISSKRNQNNNLNYLYVQFPAPIDFS